MNSTKAPSRPCVTPRSKNPEVQPVEETRVHPDATFDLLQQRRARATRVATDTHSVASDPFGDALTAGFESAVEAAIQEAFDAGLAVPGRENGKPVERRPDGKIVEIQDTANWSPDGWKKRP